MPTRSLLLFCYPRSLSNFVYATTQKALAHELRTLPTPGGEVLTLFDAEAQQGWRYYASYDLQYRRCRDLLFRECSGSVLIKDVMQPFALQRFLSEHPDFFNVLTIRRSLTDIVYCLLNRKWFWSMLAYGDTHRLLDEYRHKENREGSVSPEWVEAELLQHLVQNQVKLWRDVYSHVPHFVEYEKLVTDHTHLFEVLSNLGYTPKVVDYINDNFKRKREATALYQQDPVWLDIERRVRDYAGSLGLTNYPR